MNKLSGFMFEKIGVPNYQKYLDLSSLRHKLISGNVANASTPGYKSQDIEFQKEFENATGKGNHLQGSTTHANHIPLGQHAARDPKIESERVQNGDMNSVDIDHEMSNLAQNELRYTIGARLLQMKFSGLKKAITSK
jgi:flagellar basal-body rod protein FlgB